MLREPAVASEESFAEGGRDKLLIIKKINSAFVYDPAPIARLRVRRTKKERYIERAEGPSEWT